MAAQPLSLPAEENELPAEAEAVAGHGRHGALTVAASDTPTGLHPTAVERHFAWTPGQWEQARRLRLRSRRAHGLPDLIEDPLAIHQAGVLLRTTR